MIVLAAVVSGLAGLMEVGAAYLLGAVVDSTVAANPPAAYFGESLVLVLVYVGFYLLVRPLFFGMSAAFNGIVLPPNLAPLVQSRLHRWSLGQDVAFFDDDFAGRIAQKQTQTATALVGVVTEAVNAIAFSLATLIGAVAMLAVVDGRIAACLAIWLVLYFGLMRWYLPRIRARSKARAAARANVTGQIVDTITNVKTVKLFGHARFEDRAALDALRGFREQALRFGLLSTGFRFVLMAAAGALPVVLVLAALLLWRAGSVTPGEIAATGALAMRIAQMTGWVSFTLMAIFSNMGEVEDGMRTLTAPHRVVDKPDAIDLEKAAGRIVFDGVGFAYGRRIGGVRGMDLTVEPGEKLGIVGASGAGKSTLVSLLLRLYDPEAGRVTLDGIDLRDLTQDSLRRQIAMVTQETAMFNRSARDNILYGRPDASDAEAVAAARRARPMRSSAGCRVIGAGRGMTPIWASGASSCRAVSGNGSGWPARS